MELKAAKIENGLVIDLIAGDYNWAINRLGGEWIDATDKIIGIGYEYIDGNFRVQKPYSSWLWNEIESIWEAPIQIPNLEEGIGYIWNEEILNWEYIQLS
jgi:hypothetical protein